MKKTIYIHLTNKCGLACPSCYSCSSPCGRQFIRFEEFKEAVRAYDNWPIEVSLEGGEPLLHPHFFLFIEYLAAMENVKKIIVCTNGFDIREKYGLLESFVDRTGARLDIRFEVMSDILDGHPELLETYSEMLHLVQERTSPMLSVSFDVRWKDEDDKNFLLGKLREADIPYVLASFNGLLAYGALKNSDYPKPIVPNGPADWSCIAFDGMDFQQNLAARADYEENIVKEEWSTIQHTPVFDSKNHRRMWRLTEAKLAEARFETRDRINVPEIQRRYINSNQNRWTRQMSGRYDSYAEYYVSLFPERNDAMQNPFDIEDVCARHLESEFQRAVESAKTTMYVEWFRKSLHHAMELAETIASLPVKIGVPNTEGKSMWLLRGED